MIYYNFWLWFSNRGYHQLRDTEIFIRWTYLFFQHMNVIADMDANDTAKVTNKPTRWYKSN